MTETSIWDKSKAIVPRLETREAISHPREARIHTLPMVFYQNSRGTLILNFPHAFSTFYSGSGWPPASRLEESPGTAGHDAG